METGIAVKCGFQIQSHMTGCKGTIALLLKVQHYAVSTVLWPLLY